METREVLPAEFDTLEQELEKALPFSIFAFVHFKLMRRRDLLVEKKILVNSWPEPSVFVIVDSKNKCKVPLAVTFCKGPEFVQSLENLLQQASKNLSPPISIVGCSSDVREALIKLYESSNACPFKGNEDCGNAFKTKPNGFKISDVKECHQDIVGRSWSYGNEIGQFCCTRNYVSPLGQFPTVCIETEEGHPVALEMQHEYGAIGLLYVEPEYRKMKLGSIATRTLSEKVKNEGNLIFACVDENNKPSILFHEKNGFKRLPFRVCFMEYIF
uniref:Glycine N-acyltransferase-like protein n=1 Tax=Crassostrea virginica TaxID=6565 RepID=A0A8B8DM19_CRAVI|nr:glycine N-acyltransferase-like isoform X2 [Crassostrea virginica]